MHLTPRECAQMGDANASIPTPQPVYSRPMFGAYGDALSKSCFSFVSKGPSMAESSSGTVSGGKWCPSKTAARLARRT